MANIGILLPRQTILEYAKRVIEEEQAQVQILKGITLTVSASPFGFALK